MRHKGEIAIARVYDSLDTKRYPVAAEVVTGNYEGLACRVTGLNPAFRGDFVARFCPLLDQSSIDRGTLTANFITTYSPKGFNFCRKGDIGLHAVWTEKMRIDTDTEEKLPTLAQIKQYYNMEDLDKVLFLRREDVVDATHGERSDILVGYCLEDTYVDRYEYGDTLKAYPFNSCISEHMKRVGFISPLLVIRDGRVGKEAYLDKIRPVLWNRRYWTLSMDLTYNPVTDVLE